MTTRRDQEIIAMRMQGKTLEEIGSRFNLNIPSDPKEFESERINDEIYFVCEVEGNLSDIAVTTSMESFNSI